MPNNLESLQKLTKLINTDKIITPDEIEQVVSALVKVLANNKREVDTTAQELRELAEDTVRRVLAENSTSVKELTDRAESSRQQTQAEVQSMLDKALTEAKNLLSEARSVMPLDGKDADETVIVSRVLEQIKLPEQKEIILDGGKEIVEKINDLPTDDDDLKIDVKHIKGLKNTDGKTVFTGIKGPEVSVYDLSSYLDGVTKTFALPAFRLVFDVRSSSFPFAFRPIVDYTLDASAMTITFTSEISAAATLAAGQTLYVLLTS